MRKTPPVHRSGRRGLVPTTTRRRACRNVSMLTRLSTPYERLERTDYRESLRGGRAALPRTGTPSMPDATTLMLVVLVITDWVCVIWLAIGMLHAQP